MGELIARSVALCETTDGSTWVRRWHPRGRWFAYTLDSEAVGVGSTAQEAYENVVELARNVVECRRVENALDDQQNANGCGRLRKACRRVV